MEYSESTKCSSNLKQLGLASTLYSNDSDNYFVTSLSGTFAWLSWDDRLSDYDGRDLSAEDKILYQFPEGSPGSELYDCPTDAGAYAKEHSYAKLSYGANSDLTQCDFDYPNNNRSRRLEEVVYPTETIAFFDYPDFSFGALEKPRLGSNMHSIVKSATLSLYGPFQCSRLGGVMGIHRNGMNYGMVDGHVENLHPSETENGTFVYPHFYMWSPIMSRR